MAHEVFDVQLHAYDSVEGFGKASQADYAPHHRTASGFVESPEVQLSGTLAAMRQAGVRMGVVSGSNDAVQRWRQEHPDRFLAGYRPDLSQEDQTGAVEVFAREAGQGKWHTLGELALPYASRPLNDPSLFPYYEVCQRLGLPVAFHCGLDGPNPQKLFSPAFRVELGDPLLLQDVFTAFPDLKVIIMHLGWPFFDHALYMLYAYPTAYVDLGVVNWLLGPSILRRMIVETIETVGADRILFGSDQMAWPQMIPVAVAATAEADYLTEEQKRKILWTNAARLYGVE
jgi:predicted TIM-barrel fold metal-dependent hydrolase